MKNFLLIFFFFLKSLPWTHSEEDTKTTSSPNCIPCEEVEGTILYGRRDHFAEEMGRKRLGLIHPKGLSSSEVPPSRDFTSVCFEGYGPIPTPDSPSTLTWSSGSIKGVLALGRKTTF